MKVFRKAEGKLSEELHQGTIGARTAYGLALQTDPGGNT